MHGNAQCLRSLVFPRNNACGNVCQDSNTTFNSLTTVLFNTKYEMMLKGNNYGKSNLYAKFDYCIKQSLEMVNRNT